MKRLAAAAGLGLALSWAAVALAGSNVTVDSVDEGHANGIFYRSATNGSVPIEGPTPYIAATCPEGKVLTGGGTFVSGQAAEAAISHLGPDRSSDVEAGPKTAWTAIVDNYSGSSKLVKTYAFCAAPRGLAQRTVKRTTAAGETDTLMTLRAKCHADESVVGGGVFSESNLANRIRISAPFDGPDKGKKPDDGWKVKVLVTLDNRDTWATAICRRGKQARSKIVYASDDTTGTGTLSDGVSCPAGATLTGGGFALGGGPGGYLNSAHPLTEKFNEWGVFTRVTGTRTLDVYAVCKEP